MQDPPAAELDADAVQLEQFRPCLALFCGHYRRWVELLSATAFLRALTSASIHDW